MSFRKEGSKIIFDDDFNEPWLAIKLALKMITPEEVRAFQQNIPFGRRMIRYMDQIFYKAD